MFLSFVLAGLFSSTPDDKPTVIDAALASRYFAQADALWQKDNGQLWGKSLKGPMIFVDARTRYAVANQRDQEGQLKQQGSVFVGVLSSSVPLANATITWAGVKWIMVLWPLPANAESRAVLMMHESWHRLQNDLGLPLSSPSIEHLDTIMGRYWLQLEWRALAKALAKTGSDRSQALADALQFRRHRHKLFPQEARKEHALEMNEGLAQYSGIKLSGMSFADQVLFAVRQLEEQPQKVSTFIRWFAYWSGPAYGLLIDAKSPNWLRSVKHSDNLGEIAQKVYSIDLPHITDHELEGRAAQYHGNELLAKEQQREIARQERVASAKAKFVEGPVLILPLQKMQFSFGYSDLLPLEALGTVYPNLQLTDLWGTIVVKNGALLTTDFKSLRVAAPGLTPESPSVGDGWSLTLKPGWKIVAGERKGDFTLKQESK